MKARVLTALALIPVVGLVVHAGGWLFFATALFLALVCLEELGGAVRRAGESGALPVEARLFQLPCAATLTLLLLASQVLASGSKIIAAPHFFILAGASVVALWTWAICQFGREGGQNGRRLFSLSLSVAALAHVALWAFVILLRGRGEIWMWGCLLGVWSSDIAAFFVGRAIGKRKMSPLSPGKSWEGALGGLLGAVVSSTCVGSLSSIGALPGAVCGLAIGFLAPLGDLAESLWKRELGAKDLGTILPGHGGIFDRCDSLLFAAAGVYALSWLW